MADKLPDDDIDLTGGEVTQPAAKVQATMTPEQAAAAKDAAQREKAAQEDHQKNMDMQNLSKAD